MEHSKLDWAAFWLVLIGALNWGLVGLFEFNIVTAIFGTGTLTKVVYILVGLSAIYTFVSMKKKHKK